MLAKLAPVIINGDGATVTAGAKNALSFTSDAAYRDFIRVEVDGKTIDESNYTVESGSIIVTLKEDYVAGFRRVSIHLALFLRAEQRQLILQ